MMNGWHMTGWGGGFMMVFWIVLVILVAYPVVRVGRGENPFSKDGSQKESPLDILRRRYAAGEITKEEFDKVKRDIQ